MCVVYLCRYFYLTYWSYDVDACPLGTITKSERLCTQSLNVMTMYKNDSHNSRAPVEVQSHKFIQ